MYMYVYVRAQRGDNQRRGVTIECLRYLGDLTVVGLEMENSEM